MALRSSTPRSVRLWWWWVSRAAFVNAGALATYSTSYTNEEAGSGVADYVNRILTGVEASQLPVQQPSRFELAINLKSAAMLGIRIPRSLLLQANKLIE